MEISGASLARARSKSHEWDLFFPNCGNAFGDRWVVLRITIPAIFFPIFGRRFIINPAPMFAFFMTFCVILITSYGQVEYLEEGQALIYKTNAPVEYIQELEEAHLKFITVGDDGAYWYKVYRGSHTYDSREMHVLLEGTIAEAKEQGIETKTPDEIRHMEEQWTQYLKQK